MSEETKETKEEEQTEQVTVSDENAEQSSSETNKTTNEGQPQGNIWIPIGIACTVVLVVIGFLVMQLNSSNTEGSYIGGNILYTPYTSNVEEGWPEYPALANPWRYMIHPAGLMYRTLLLADPSFESTTPDLAKGVLVSEDGLTYTIIMKDDVVWSDGTPLTVDDVVFSMEAILVATSANAVITSALSRIVGAEAHMEDYSIGLEGLTVEGTSITMKLSEPYFQMELALSQLAIIPKHILGDTDWTQMISGNEEFWHNPVVNGMYRVDIEHDGEYIKWVKNEYYEGTEPHIDEIHGITNYEENGDYDATTDINKILLYDSMRGRTRYPVETVFLRYFFFNIAGIDGNENEAMQDERVRKALGYAIDRETLLRRIYMDAGTILDSGVPSSHSASLGSDTAVEYDPEKAKELLEEAEYDFERPIRMTYYYSDDISLAFIDGVVANLEAIGLKVETFHVNDTGMTTSEFLYGGGEGAREYDIALKGYSALSVYESYIEYLSTNETLSMNFGGVTAFEEPVNRLYAARSLAEAEVILEELQMLEFDLYYKIPLFTMDQVIFINTDRVNIPSNITFSNVYYRSDWKFEEWSIKQE